MAPKITVRRATRKANIPMKALLYGPAGAGKTWTALEFGTQIAGPDGRILVLDTESGKASLYADDFVFDVVEFWPRDENRNPIPKPFHPNRFLDVIRYAENEKYDVLIIDSLTHSWSGTGGWLDINRENAKFFGKNTEAAWSKTTPEYKLFVEAIMDARIHLICTARNKSGGMSSDKNDKNQTVTTEKAFEPDLRSGIKFEFQYVFKLHQGNLLEVENTKYRPITGAEVIKPTGAFLDPVIQWHKSGSVVEAPAVAEIEETSELVPASNPAPSTGDHDHHRMDPALSNFLKQVKELGKQNGIITTVEEWNALKKQEHGSIIPDINLTREQITKLRGAITIKIGERNRAKAKAEEVAKAS